MENADNIYRGDLTITTKNRNDFAHIVEVTGNLHIRAEASLPVLATVRGSLSIEASASLPVLATVGGTLYIWAEASLPVLATVGGYLYISIGVNFDYSAIDFGAGLVLAVLEYALHLKDGMYCAGCRGPWTADRALKHWATDHHEPSRATLFREAIEAQKVAA